MENSLISLHCFIKQTIKLNFGVNNESIFLMVVITSILLSWICILLMIAIIYKKIIYNRLSYIHPKNMNYVWSAWSCYFFVLIVSTLYLWNLKYLWRYPCKEWFSILIKLLLFCSNCSLIVYIYEISNIFRGIVAKNGF